MAPQRQRGHFVKLFWICGPVVFAFVCLWYLIAPPFKEINHTGLFCSNLFWRVENDQQGVGEALQIMHKCIKMDDTLFLKSPNSSELSLLSGLRWWWWSQRGWWAPPSPFTIITIAIIIVIVIIIIIVTLSLVKVVNWGQLAPLARNPTIASPKLWSTSSSFWSLTLYSRALCQPFCPVPLYNIS